MEPNKINVYLRVREASYIVLWFNLTETHSPNYSWTCCQGGNYRWADLRSSLNKVMRPKRLASLVSCWSRAGHEDFHYSYSIWNFCCLTHAKRGRTNIYSADRKPRLVLPRFFNTFVDCLSILDLRHLFAEQTRLHQFKLAKYRIAPNISIIQASSSRCGMKPCIGINSYPPQNHQDWLQSIWMLDVVTI